MGRCYTDHRNKRAGLDVDNVYFEQCDDCTEIWIFGKWEAGRAAAFRTYIALGRTWKVAYEKAANYRQEIVTEPARVRARGVE